MKQLLQNARTGAIEVADVPSPRLLPGCVLVRIAASLVSSGTERAASAFASKNLLSKAVARPDLVRDFVTKVQRDGLVSAAQVARSRLDQPLALGYSSAGIVVAVAADVTGLQPGDHVACAGAGHAVHAEFACVPRLLVAKFPEPGSISFEEAAFATVGAVALHGIRNAEAKLGDVVAVIGLGLLGQLSVQILKAAGCRVVGFDPDQQRAQLALCLGAQATAASPDHFKTLCGEYSQGRGADAVLICAETPSSHPVNLAAEVVRDRAVVVAVGTVGMDIDRKLYYAKELDFRVSRSYGPGRYDSVFEQKGRDYPAGYVRWTETRNMEAFLQLLTDGKLKITSIISHRFPIQAADKAFELIGEKAEPSLGVVLTYPADRDTDQLLEIGPIARCASQNAVSVSVIGAGSFATSTLIPALKKITSVQLHGVCTASGLRARHVAQKFGFQYCTTDEQQILKDRQCNTVIVSSRNHLHATHVIAALEADKHVFCEKPLCLRQSELLEIVQTYTLHNERLLMVGFNRRFAPMITRLKSFFAGIHEPLAMNYRVNAGRLPPDHWSNDPDQGGGRVLGEMCHFVDLMLFLADSLPVRVYARALADSMSGDSLAVILDFANGSQGAISYLANGDRAFSKERLEVFGAGATAVLDDFRRLELIRDGRKKTFRSHLRQDKGHLGEMQAFTGAVVNGSSSPISLKEIIATTLAAFRIQDSLTTGVPAEVDIGAFVASATVSEPAGSIPA